MIESKYRPDIDGLRAIAIILVVGYHFFPAIFPGGFIGVDVFFVISGYLISRDIYSRLENERFSFLEFYSRRIKRLFPALILVLTSSFAFGYISLLAEEFKALGIQIVGASLFFSNILFWNEAGYFDVVAELKPLLNLWSLGVEEQFYLIFPLLFFILWRKKLNYYTFFLIIMFASFFLNKVEVSDDLYAAFYSPQTRLWEFFIGALFFSNNNFLKK